MKNHDTCQFLVSILDNLEDFQKDIPLPAQGNEDIGLVIDAINRLLAKANDKLRASDQVSDSLATASVRMVLLAEVQENLDKADKQVRSPDDLNTFFKNLLVDLVFTVGAKKALFLPKESIGSANQIQVCQCSEEEIKALKQSTSFQRIVTDTSTSRTINTYAAKNDEHETSIGVPLQVNQRLVGGIFLIGKQNETDFNRDDLSLIEHLLPSIQRVLERIDLVAALEASNRTLQAEQDKLRAMTNEINQTMAFLEVANDNLHKNFIATVHVFANLLEMREGQIAGHSRRVADLARTLAQRLGLSNNEIQDIFLAGLLHDIGKLALSDVLMKKPFSTLSAEERSEVVKHPVKGEMALLAIDQLRQPAKILRHHHERFDGLGYPDNLTGLMIPIGARILAVANEFDAVQNGTVLSKRLNKNEALQYIQDGRGNRYDPAVVDAFLGKVIKPAKHIPDIHEISLLSIQLQTGMVLSRNLNGSDGNLLLSKDYRLSENIIQQIKGFEKTENTTFTIWVYKNKSE